MSNTTQIVSVDPGQVNTSTTSLIAPAVSFTIVILAMLSNVGAIFAIVKSHLRTSFSGRILINQAIADMGFLALLLAIIIEKTDETEATDAAITNLLLLSAVCVGVGSHSMAMISVNLFLAICHYHRYKSLITGKRLVVAICMSWILNASFSISMYFNSSRFFYYDRHYGKVMSRYTPDTWWIGTALIINCPLFPFITSSVCFVLVVRYTSKTVQTSLNINSAKRYKLSKAILINMALFASTYAPLLVTNSFSNSVPQKITTLLHVLYHIGKMPLLMKFYPALSEQWMTCQRERSVSPINIDTCTIASTVAHGESMRNIAPDMDAAASVL